MTCLSRRLSGLSSLLCFAFVISTAAFLGLSTKALANNNRQLPDSSSNEKQETELRLGLTQDGFNCLLGQWADKSEHSFRSDLYFDVFEDEKFLIRRSEPRAKLRIQERQDELVVQKSWIDNQDFVTSNDFVWSVTTRSSSSDRFASESSTQDKYNSTRALLGKAVAKNSIQKSELTNLQKLWSTHTWPTLDSYDHGTSALQGPLIPAAIVRKERWSFPIKLSNGKSYKIQFGRDTDALLQSQPQNFELEVEIRKPSLDTDADLISSLSQFLREHGLTKDQTSTLKTYDFFQRLENLFALAGH